MLVNLPLIGATTFHLFTTYPIEPGWVVRHRRIQLLPYLAALVLAALLADRERALGAAARARARRSRSPSRSALIVVVARDRRRSSAHRHGDGPLRDRADLMFSAALVSFLPICRATLAEWIVRDAVPVLRGAAVDFVFPLAVGYGIVRRQLFEVRSRREVVGRLRRRDARDHGRSSRSRSRFADALVSRLNVSAPPASR